MREEPIWTIARIEQRRSAHLHSMECLRERNETRTGDYRLHEEELALCDLALAQLKGTQHGQS
jgi:hypothetical protein